MSASKCQSSLSFQYYLKLCMLLELLESNYRTVKFFLIIKYHLFYHCFQLSLKVPHKNENFFGFDLEFCTISLLVMHK
jgi:hypothetical protein